MALCQMPFTSPATNACSSPEPSVYSPAAPQLPADAHDTESTRAPPPWLRAAVPGTSMAACQMPFTAVATNARPSPELMELPPAAPLPATAHDTHMTAAAPPWLRAAVPGSSLAVPQVPFRSPATNACSRPEPSAYPPPAAQLPADAHDTELATAPPPALRAAVPGTSCAVPQVPSKTTAPASAAAGTTPAASVMLTPATTAAASPPPRMPRTGLITMTTPPCRPVATPVPGPFAG